MEWCPMCQKIKPVRVTNFNNMWTKHCRDCNSMMGMFTQDDANKIIVERDYYKKYFYGKELEKNEEKT